MQCKSVSTTTTLWNFLKDERQWSWKASNTVFHPSLSACVDRPLGWRAASSCNPRVRTDGNSGVKENVTGEGGVRGRGGGARLQRMKQEQLVAIVTADLFYATRTVVVCSAWRVLHKHTQTCECAHRHSHISAAWWPDCVAICPPDTHVPGFPFHTFIHTHKHTQTLSPSHTKQDIMFLWFKITKWKSSQMSPLEDMLTLK